MSASARNSLRSALDRASMAVVRFASSDVFVWLMLLVFTAEAAFFAIRIRFGLPPDENYHYSFIQLMVQHLPWPFFDRQSGFDVVDDAIHTPFFLYHYLLAFPFALLQSMSRAYILVRFINVLLGLGSLLVVKRIANELDISKLARNLSLFMLANTLMFTFLSASINYDNLFVLVSLLLILSGILLYRRTTLTNVLAFVCLLLAGSMTKLNFLPFGTIVVVVLAILMAKTWRSRLQSVRSSVGNQRWQTALLLGLVILLSVLFIGKYGVNVVSYHSYDPPCPAYRATTACLRSGLYSRGVFIKQHPEPVTITIVHYSYDWLKMIVQRTYGVFGQKRFNSSPAVTVLMALYLVAGGALAAYSIAKSRQPILLAIGAMTTLYLAALFIENHAIYAESGRVDLAVHGRYLFNVLPVAYLFINSALLQLIKPPRYKAVIIISLIVLFFFANIPAFLASAPASWYNA